MKKIFKMINYYVILKVWSFIINCFYCVSHFKSIIYSFKKKTYLQELIKTKSDISNELKKFKWKKDKFIDWVPWITVIIDRHIMDDCDGIAVYTKWLYGLINIDIDIVWLYGFRCAHVICVTKDRKIMISNGEHYNITDSDWEMYILNSFNNKYNEVIVF